ITATPLGLTPAPPKTLALVSMRGEQPVDALLVELVEMGLSSTLVLEAQGLREALAREVPLFAGFADIFGDPGGRRVLLIEIESRRLQSLLHAIAAICTQHQVDDAWVGAVPLHAQWHYRPPAPDDEPTKGH